MIQCTLLSDQLWFDFDFAEGKATIVTGLLSPLGQLGNELSLGLLIHCPEWLSSEKKKGAVTMTAPGAIQQG